MSATKYGGVHTLLDVTCTQLNAGATVTSPKTGKTPLSSSNIQVSPNSILSSSLNATNVADGLWVEITPPIDNQASANMYPDLAVSFVLDDKNIKDKILLDGSYYGNMAPMRTKTNGRRLVTLGTSLYSLIQRRMIGEPISNMALMGTGLKISDSLAVTITSNAGFGNNGVPVQGFRIRVYGDLLDEAMLQGISTGFDGNMHVWAPPAPEFLGTAVVAGGVINLGTWSSLPGGNGQSGTQIWRKQRFAYNASPTDTNGVYTFTQQPTLLGSESNVSLAEYDLGFNYNKTNKRFLNQEIGFRIPVEQQAYVGWYIGGEYVPNSTQYGQPIDGTANPYQYGNAYPVESDSGRFLTMVDAKELAKVFLNNVSGVPYVSTAGTTSIAANQASCAISGIEIEG